MWRTSHEAGATMMPWQAAYGRRLAHRSTAWLVPTSLAVAVFIVAWSGLAVAAAAYDGRFARTEARTPVEAETPADAAFRYAPMPATSGLQQVWVIYIRPTRSDVPPPPGLNRWPKPGEAFLSPAAQAAVAAPGSWSSWSPGSVVGVIGPEGLATPTEALAYVNPPKSAYLPTSQWLPGASFGGTGLAGWGDVQSIYEWPLFVVLYLPTIAIPATLLLAGAWLAGSRRRRKAERTLVLLGATAAQRAAMRLSGVTLPWLSGAVLAAAAIGVAGATDINLPYVNYPLLAIDVRRWATPLAAVWIAAAIVSLLALHAQAPARTLLHKRRAGRPGAVQWMAAAVGLLAVVAAIPALNMSGLDHDAIGYATMMTLVVAVLTMPALCAVTVWLAVRFLRRIGGLATTVGVGLLRQGRAQVAALAGTLGASLCLLTVVNVFVSTPGPFDEIRPIYASSIGHVVTVGSSHVNLSRLTPARWASLTHDADRVVLAVAKESGGDVRWQLYADRAAPQGKEVGGTCRLSRDTPEALRHALAPMDVTSCPLPLSARPTTADQWVVALYRADGTLGPSNVSRMVSTWAAPLSVDVPASAYVGNGPLSSKVQQRWIPWCASVGLLLMVAALVQFAAGDLQHARRRIAGYLILGAPDAVATRAMTLRLALPAAIAIGYGAIFSMQRPMMLPGKPADYSIGLFLMYAAIVTVGIAVAVLINSAAARRYLLQWRPGKGRE